MHVEEGAEGKGTLSNRQDHVRLMYYGREVAGVLLNPRKGVHNKEAAASRILTIPGVLGAPDRSTHRVSKHENDGYRHITEDVDLTLASCQGQ